MKKSVWLLSALLFLATGALAHPPSDINASFDASNNYLTVRVTHNSLNPQKHYIKQVSVSVGDDNLLTQNFKMQFSKKEQIVIFFTPDLKPGTEITINAKCSWFGEKTKKILLTK